MTPRHPWTFGITGSSCALAVVQLGEGSALRCQCADTVDEMIQSRDGFHLCLP